MENRTWRTTSAALLLVLSVWGCAGRSDTTNAPVQTAEESALLQDFRARIDSYMQLRTKAVDAVADAEVTRDPAEIAARKEALAARIRALRPDARAGDIFTSAIRAHFRKLLAPRLTGAKGEQAVEVIEDVAPAPGAVPIDVNAKYPSGVPLPSVPPSILRALPTLPEALEYRIIGSDLVLIDQPADLIVDYIRNATRGATAP